MTTNATLETAPVTGETAPETRVRPSYDDINAPVIFLIGIISAIVTLLIIWAVEGLYYHWHSDLVRERNYDVTNPRQVDLIDAQKEQLLGVPDKGYASLESVIPRVIDEYRTGDATQDPAAAADPEAEGH